MNYGKIVFAQIMQFVPRREFNDIVAKYRGNYRVRNFTCYDQLLVMCLAQYADKNSLRDIEASLNALAVTHKLYHCGIGYAVPRNTLAKAFEKIPIPELFNKPINNVPKDDGQLDLFRDLKS